MHTLESETDVGQGINIGPGKFGNNNKCRAWNKMCKLVLKKTPKNLKISKPIENNPKINKRKAFNKSIGPGK